MKWAKEYAMMAVNGRSGKVLKLNGRKEERKKAREKGEGVMLIITAG